MAFHAVLEIADAFFQVLRLNTLLSVFVAAVAGVLLKVRRHVARLASDVAFLAMIQREGVIERGPLPGAGAVTLRAV